MKAALVVMLLLIPTCLFDGPVPVHAVPPAPVVKRHTPEQCIATAIYREASGEPVEGQRAVYEVIMHRARMFKSKLCDVVKAPKQFSWYEGPDNIMPMTKALHELLRRVKNHPSVLEGPKFKWFFRRDLSPKWAGEMECREIGEHKFCKEADEEEGENGSTREVRHPGTGAEEESQRDHGSHLRDVRNRVPTDGAGGTEHAQGQVAQQRQQPGDSVQQDAGPTDGTPRAVRSSQSGDAGQG